MANPYAQFLPDEDEQPAAPPQPVVIQPGENPAAAGFPDPADPAVDTNNVYAQPEALQPTGEPLSNDQFYSQFIQKLREGESLPNLQTWAQSVGHKLIDNEGLRANIAIRDQAMRDGTIDTVQFGRQEVVPAGEAPRPDSIVDSGGAFIRKAANVPLYNFGDEIFAAGQALTQPGAFGENYEKNWLSINARDQMDEELHPGMSTAGTIAGVGASILMPTAIYDRGVRMLPKVADTATRGTRAVNVAARSGVGAATGAAAGATAATGEGGIDNRFEHTGGGFVLGGATGAAFPLVAAALSRVSRPVFERLFPNSSKALAKRGQMDESELAAAEAELKRQQDMGLEPSLIDVVPERVRNVVGTAGRHDDAREMLQRGAEERLEALPGRVTTRFREEVSSDTTPPADYARRIGEDRDAEMDTIMERLRDQPVPMGYGDGEELINVLATNQGRAAIRRAIDAEPNVDRKRQMTEMVGVLDELDNIPPNLGAAARDQIIGQLLRGREFTVGFLDRVQRELGRAADGGGTDRASLGALQSTVRNSMEGNEEYRTAMREYSIRSRAMEAPNVGTGGTFNRDETAGFLREDPARFDEQVRRTREQPEWTYDVRTTERLQDIEQEVQLSGVADPDDIEGFLPEFYKRARRAGIHEDDISGFVSRRMAGERAIVQTRDPVEFSGTFRTPDRLEQPLLPGGRRAGEARQQVAFEMSQMSDDELIRGLDRATPGSALWEEVYQRLNLPAPGERISPELRQAFQRRTETIGQEAQRARQREANRTPVPRHLQTEVRFEQQQGYRDLHNIAYDLPDGGKLTGSVEIKPNADVAHITVNGISDWGTLRNQYGAGVMREVASAIRRQWPQVRVVAGERVTGTRSLPTSAPLDPWQSVPARDPLRRKDAPSERELARTGAAYAAEREAGKGPEQAGTLARKMTRSPDQQARTRSLVGTERAERLEAKLDEEVKRVYRVTSQVTREGGRGEGTSAAVEGFVNTMYAPTSPVPWIREGLRFLHKVGMTERDAKWIVNAALDPNRTQDIIDKLRKHGLSQDQAVKWEIEMRDGLVRYLNQQEGSSGAQETD